MKINNVFLFRKYISAELRMIIVENEKNDSNNRCPHLTIIAVPRS